MNHLPPLKFLVASPSGDKPVIEERLDYPLECDPKGTSYRTYFNAIRNFITGKGFMPLLKAASDMRSKVFRAEDINQILVRTEKHGSLYHPASIELIAGKDNIKFGLNVAVTEIGKDWLAREFSTLSTLQSKYEFRYLPMVHFYDEQQAVSFLLEEWFEGYHEFHLSVSENGKQAVSFWEFGKGCRVLNEWSVLDIYRQAAKILTLYYDIEEFSQIYPWHHSAGDFIARVEEDNVDVRLTTARQYDPYLVFSADDQMNPVIALFYFFLNLALRIRLDRLDGVGEVAWAEKSCLGATLQGFMEALPAKKGFEDNLGSPMEFISILKSFSEDDLMNTYQPLVKRYEGSGDFGIISGKLQSHVRELYATLQNYP